MNCIACEFEKIEWKEYACPRCQCPQIFSLPVWYGRKNWRYIVFLFTLFKRNYIEIPLLLKRYKQRIYEDTCSKGTYICFRSRMDRHFNI